MVGICLCLTRETIDTVGLDSCWFHHSAALLEPESEASSLLELVCMVTVSSTRFSLDLRPRCLLSSQQ